MLLWTPVCQYLLGPRFRLFWFCTQEWKLLGHVLILCLIVLRKLLTAFTVLTPFTFPWAVHKASKKFLHIPHQCLLFLALLFLHSHPKEHEGLSLPNSWLWSTSGTWEREKGRLTPPTPLSSFNYYSTPGESAVLSSLPLDYFFQPFIMNMFKCGEELKGFCG